MNTNSNYVHQPQLGKWNWDAIGDIVQGVGDTASSFTGGSGGSNANWQRLLQQQQQLQQKRQQFQLQQQRRQQPQWLWPLVIGGGALGLVGITAAMLTS